jgi:zinc and cadmium transporter
MPVILQVVICSLAGGVLSLIGGVALMASKKRQAWAEYATAFAAGALLAAAFVDLLPEALEDGNDPHLVLTSTLVGLVLFFVLEAAINWFHRHVRRGKDAVDPIVPLIVIGDTVHNFIDGIAIAAGFLISPISGILVTIAVAAHEIPQEVGDFGIMLHKGVKRSKVLLINVLSALATTLSAVIFYLIGDAAQLSFAPVLGIVAGFFIYIALSDIIPSIHLEKTRREVLKKSLILIAGTLLVGIVIVLLHGLEG